MAANNEEEDEIFGFEVLYRELGYYITKKEQFERALPFFDQSISKGPNDKRALVGRSIARAKAVQYEGAIEDITKALELDPDDLNMLAQKALNTYLICNFEDGLVQNLKQLPKRRKPDNFSMGVMHCNQAIENCIGERAGRPLRDHFKIIRHLAWKKSFATENSYEESRKLRKKKKLRMKKLKDKGPQKKKAIEAVVPLFKPKRSGNEDDSAFAERNLVTPSGIVLTGPAMEIRDSLYSHLEQNTYIPKGKYFPHKPLQNFTSNIENFMAEKYLEGMYLDKIFLKTLKYNPGVKSPNEVGFKKILQLARDGHKTLSYKQELLRTRRPFYFIKYQETKLSDNLKKKLANDIRKIQESTQHEADVLLERIKQAIEEKHTRLALESADKLKQMCDLKPRKYLPNKNEYLKELYKLVGKAHLDVKRLNKDMYQWDQEKRIFHMLGCVLSREPSTDSVLREYKDVFIDWRKQISIAENRLRVSTDRQEMCWLYHDLSRYHTELKQFELAKVYARKCIQEGRKCDEYPWVINGLMMVTRINLALHNRNDAKLEVAEALEIAKHIGDTQLEEYLEATMVVVEKLDFEDMFGSNVLEKREKKIVEIMGESGMKEEVSHLFRKMSVMPASRRMSVMPGVRFTDDSETTSVQSKKHRKQSIMGNRQNSEEDFGLPAPKKGQQKDKTNEFMNLIQFMD